jgi:hypothetical protein
VLLPRNVRPSAGAGPVGVEELAARLIHARAGVRAEDLSGERGCERSFAGGENPAGVSERAVSGSTRIALGGVSPAGARGERRRRMPAPCSAPAPCRRPFNIADSVAAFEYKPRMPRETLTAVAEDRLLGTMPDRLLAERLGCSRQAIVERRRKLRIPPFHPHRRPWSRAEEELLGTMPDKRLARRLNRSAEGVAARRAAKGIPIFNPKKHRWQPADDKLLGGRPDAQIALLLGISRLAVHHRRRRLGIAPAGGRKFAPPPPWRPSEDALLGSAPDTEVARRLGRSVANVSRRRHHLGIRPPGHHWTPEADALLGKLPDKKVAARLGCTVKAVSRRRERLGIPAWRTGSKDREVRA